MTWAVELVFEYRTLLARRAHGSSLEWDDIATVQRATAAFGVPAARRSVTDRRESRRVRTGGSGRLRHRGFADPIELVDLALGGAAIRGAPFAAPGDVVELVIDRGVVSIRQRAEVRRVREDGIHFEVGLAFVGGPVRLRYSEALRDVAA